jgi:non-specific serine/threonine protein kinase
LALRLAAGVVDDFRDGVWLVDFAPVSAPNLLAQAIANVLGVREGPQRPARDALTDALRHRQVLLVLDNCEHLIEACADLVATLLLEAAGLRVVATSREALGVTGETVFRVPSLSLPGEPMVSAEALLDAEATHLFLDRARAVDPTFTLTHGNASSIARICQRLDGIPLAIELAAARVMVLSVEQIETRLRDRFRLLIGGARTAVARHRTLEATVDWSYDLLSIVERQLLCRLSVFPASWTLDAAEKVCGGDGIAEQDVLDLLSRLVSKSLVAIDLEDVGERRFRFLETVRQYARERLAQAGAADAMRERHFSFYFNEFRGVRPVLQGHGQAACIRRLRTEQENVRAALEFALTSPSLAEAGLELAGALFWFWTKRGQFKEGALWLERAAAAAGHARVSLRACAMIGLAHMHYFQGHYADVVDDVTEALKLGRQVDDAWVVSVATFILGLLAFESGNYEQAVAHAVAARQVADAGGEFAQNAPPLLILANVAVLNGDLDRAQHLYDESIVVQRHAGDTWGLSISLSVAAGLRIVRNDFDQARAQVSEALSVCQELDDPRGIAWSLDVFAGLLAAGGELDGAARLWGTSNGLLESVCGAIMPPLTWIRDRYLEPVRSTLGIDRFQRVCAEGRAMPVAKAIALARQRSAVLRPRPHGTATGRPADRGRGIGRRSRGAAIRSRKDP